VIDVPAVKVANSGQQYPTVLIGSTTPTSRPEYKLPCAFEPAIEDAVGRGYPDATIG
jgi:hypothetical protein